MSVWLAWVRHDLRRRRWRLASLALLVAIGAGVVMSVVAGTRRSASAIERMERAVVPATATVLTNEPGFDWSAVAALPEVTTLVQFPVTYYEVVGLGADYAGFPPASPNAVTEVERPIVLDGRTARQDRVDEVTISPVVRDLGVDVGDRLTLRVPSIDDVLAGNVDGPAAHVDVSVVGVTKGSFFANDVQTTYAFFDAHRDRLVGEHGYINALVRLRRGGADLPALQADIDELAGHPVEVWDVAAVNERYRRAVNVETTALGAFGVATFAAVVVLVGQALSRMTASKGEEPAILAQLGVTRRAAAAAVAAAPALAAIAGVAAAPIVAYVLSGRYPIGIGRHVDPTIGRRVDWVSYAIGGLALAGCFVVVVAAVSRRVVAGAVRRPATRRSRSAAAFARPVEAPVWMAIGTRLALGWRRRAGPAAVTGVATCGVAGVVAAITFGVGLDRATTDASLYGQYYDVYADVAIGDAAATAANVTTGSAAVLRNVIVALDGHSVSTVSITPISGRPPVQPRRGELPTAVDEIALAPEELEILDVDVGDSVGLGDGSRLTVVGEVFTPVTSHTTYSSGAVIAPELTALLLEEGFPLKFELLALDLPPGADPAAAIDALSDTAAVYAEEVGPVERQDALRPTRQLPILFGSFVAALALGAVAHALTSTERRRRHEVAVLQVLGLTRGQARLTVVWHATLAAVVGLAVGIPVGYALGRTLWEAVAGSVPAFYRTPHAWVFVAMAVPAAVVAVYVAAAWPARRTARLEPAIVLRAE